MTPIEKMKAASGQPETEPRFEILGAGAKHMQDCAEGRHDFRCMWSIGDEVSGYEFTHKHPGNEAHATGAIQSWTLPQLAEHLNAMEKMRGPFIAAGSEEHDLSSSPKRHKDVGVERTSKWSKVDKSVLSATAKEVGTQFKQLRKQANINQARAGELIGESQMFVSMLERGHIPSRKIAPTGMRTALAEFEQNLKTLQLI